MTTATSAEPVPFRQNRLLQALVGLFVVLWIVSGIRPIMVEDWWLENGLVFLFMGVLIATYRWLPLSQTSYLLIFVYLLMHEWGAHHRYADVPLGEWMKPWLHTARNDYDRVVHFAFGLLLAYPMREVLVRKAGVRGGWSYSLPVVIALGLGAAYELLEGLAAVTLELRFRRRLPESARRPVGHPQRYVHGPGRRGGVHGRPGDVAEDPRAVGGGAGEGVANFQGFALESRLKSRLLARLPAPHLRRLLPFLGSGFGGLLGLAGHGCLLRPHYNTALLEKK